ncbi:hypothetical protein [Neotamlana laminarinivorans]|uniref:Uncharacterized protein n=1 Tax=Neotamlana laminarinivorans TaxID=2883124 RepID=A0A9X1I0E2_9FLAO|nr:hypothetical protein [Tamlana laminarinivorans]MCB4798650.1 hypothetical protein [Tamlana laminarinivorans]
MRKLIFGTIALSLMFVNCKNEQDPFLVEKQNVGLLTDSTQVKELKTIFANDSISQFESGEEFSGDIRTIEIFEKGGQKLLVLTPERILDSTSVIKTVQIIDARYKTEKNISTLSTFKDISSTYKISKISNLINSVLVTVNELNASFAISKEELPANLRFDMKLKIEETHIPDNAKIKYFFINW